MIGGDVCTSIAQRRGGDGVEIFHGTEVVQQGVAGSNKVWLEKVVAEQVRLAY